MRVLVLQLDGTARWCPAILRHARFGSALGDDVTFRYLAGNAAQRSLWDGACFDRVYASAIFTKTRPRAERVLEAYPGAIVGGTGWDTTSSLEARGVHARGRLAWEIYPEERRSVGFTQRGCRLRCSFCVVPAKEGAVREEQTVAQLWRGEGFPRDLVLLDNDFFGQPRWRDRVRELRDGAFRVSLTQGINARLLDDEPARRSGGGSDPRGTRRRGEGRGGARGRPGACSVRSNCTNPATVAGLSAALDPANAPTVRKRTWDPPSLTPHASATFNRGNGKFACTCGRVHRWGFDCRALQCWCGHWHVRKDMKWVTA